MTVHDFNKSEAWNLARSDYKNNSWELHNPYDEGTQEHKDYQEGWQFAEFADKVENGYFDWIDESDTAV